MLPNAPVQSFGELVERFPGIQQLEPSALGKLAFHAALHTPAESVLYGDSNEQPEDWQWEVRDVLRTVLDWKEYPNGLSRYDLAKRITDTKQSEKEERDAVEGIESASADEGLAIAMRFLASRGVVVATEFEPSPLFPDGRDITEPLSKYTDQKTGRPFVPYGSRMVEQNGNSVPPDIERFLERVYSYKKSAEVVGSALEQLEPVDQIELERLTKLYGAKAAALLCYEKRFAELMDTIGNGHSVADMEIPPFSAVSTDLYKAWKTDTALFEEMVELVRQDALHLPLQRRYEVASDLVAIRSSAVWSEDGEHSSGAGVYASVAVNPNDPAEFIEGIRAVFASVDAEGAVSYRESRGIASEEMGLVLQCYIEKQGRSSRRDRSCYWGHANSVGPNQNLIDIHTNEGVLMYDKNSILGALMLDTQYSGRYGDDNTHIHTHPDHDTPLYGAIRATDPVPHAVVLAEKLFGRPMQVEFVNKSIVQVRPLLNIQSGETVEFPEDVDHVAVLASVGVGDMTLPYLDRNTDNTGKEGYIVFDQEYEYSIQGTKARMLGQRHVGYRAFPDRGVVVILNPSSSGHIQAICREKGLICVYPPKNVPDGTDWRELDELIYEQDGRFRTNNPRNTLFRFVSDGYIARMYVAQETTTETDQY